MAVNMLVTGSRRQMTRHMTPQMTQLRSAATAAVPASQLSNKTRQQLKSLRLDRSRVRRLVVSYWNCKYRGL
jgi:hypothetical protein